MALDVLYANGQVLGVANFYQVNGIWIPWDGTVAATFSAASIAINDGATPSRKASVFALTNSNPVVTALVDANGNQIVSFGGGTQYTDGAATPANPIGTMPVYDNAGTISKVGTTRPLPIQASSLPLPTGASTEATLALIKAKTDNIDVALSTRTKPADSQHAVLDAGTALIGTVSASLETNTLYNGTTALTPKFAKIAVSGSGNNNLVAAVTSKKIRCLGYNMMANGTVNAKFQSDGAGTPADLTGLKYMIVNVGISVSFNPLGWFESASGKSLDLNLSAGVAVGGELVYVEV